MGICGWLTNYKRFSFVDDDTRKILDDEIGKIIKGFGLSEINLI